MRRSLIILLGILGAFWLASVGVMLLFVAGLTSVPYLIAAIVVQVGVFCVAAAVLLVTNTRRPAGKDPDAPEGGARVGVVLPDGRPYGRRSRDDVSVVDRLSDILEEEARKHPGPAKTPDWAINLTKDGGPSTPLRTGQVEIADERADSE